MRAEALKELNKGKNWDEEFQDLEEAVKESINGEQWLKINSDVRVACDSACEMRPLVTERDDATPAAHEIE